MKEIRVGIDEFTFSIVPTWGNRILLKTAQKNGACTETSVPIELMSLVTKAMSEFVVNYMEYEDEDDPTEEGA